MTIPAPPASNPAPLLDIRSLSVDLPAAAGGTRLVSEVSLRVFPHERVALVGESGSGKTVTAQSIMRLQPGMSLSGKVLLDGVDLLRLPEARMRGYRGSQISMVFQDPLRSLDPLATIGSQVAEPLRLRKVGQRESRRRATAMLDEVGLPRAADLMSAYPHELSGGMRQRVALAMALIAEPRLLIADEPTTALDVRVQEKVLTLIDQVCQQRGLAVMLITHDLGIVASFADRVAVMYAGRLVEQNPVVELFARPLHPYSRALLDAVPRIDRDVAELATIPGAPAGPLTRPSGCAFHPRCPAVMDICRLEAPALNPVGHASVACHLYPARAELAATGS